MINCNDWLQQTRLHFFYFADSSKFKSVKDYMMQIFCVQKALRKKEILEADFIITVSENFIGAPTMREKNGAITLFIFLSIAPCKVLCYFL